MTRRELTRNFWPLASAQRPPRRKILTTPERSSFSARSTPLSGRTADAIREGEHAAELLPPSKDSINGGLIQQKLAGIYAQTGDADHAFSVLEKACKVANGVTYGSLKLEEDWDPLRHDPRFEKIVASLAPKSEAKQ